MLFFLKYDNQKDIDKIPSTYLVMNISGQSKKLKHPNLTSLKLLPDESGKKLEKSKAKDQYVHKIITEYKEGMTVIANYLINHSHDQSVVIICKEFDSFQYGFNPAKVLCEFIEKRYEYKAYKFTNTVVKDMRADSKFTAKGLTRLIKDMNALRKNQS